MPEPQRQLVIYVLREPGFLEETLRSFREAGITGAETLESQGTDELMSHDVPLFASFRHIFTGAQSYNYVIMAPIDDASQLQALVERLTIVLADAPPSQRGVLYAVPLSFHLDLATLPGRPGHP